MREYKITKHLFCVEFIVMDRFKFTLTVENNASTNCCRSWNAGLWLVIDGLWQWLCLATGQLTDSMSGRLSFLLDWHYSVTFHLTSCMYLDQICNLYSNLAFSSPQPKAHGNKSILQCNRNRVQALQTLGLNGTYKAGLLNAEKEQFSHSSSPQAKNWTNQL